MKQRNAGFTLIEMMVALAIGGILTAIAVPNFSQMREGYRLRSAAYQVFAVLQRARSEAVKKNNNYEFLVTSSTTYRVHDDLDSNGAINGGEPTTTTDIAADSPGVTMASDVQRWNGAAWGSEQSITFAPDGTTGGAADVARQGTITLTNTNGQQRQIVVSASGRIRIN